MKHIQNRTEHLFYFSTLSQYNIYNTICHFGIYYTDINHMLVF